MLRGVCGWSWRFDGLEVLFVIFRLRMPRQSWDIKSALVVCVFSCIAVLSNPLWEGICCDPVAGENFILHFPFLSQDFIQHAVLA